MPLGLDSDSPPVLFPLVGWLCLPSLCFSLVFPTLCCQSELSNSDCLCQDSFFFSVLFLETMQIKGCGQTYWIGVRRSAIQRKWPLVGVSMSFSTWEERSDLHFNCPRTTVYMKYLIRSYNKENQSQWFHPEKGSSDNSVNSAYMSACLNLNSKPYSPEYILFCRLYTIIYLNFCFSTHRLDCKSLAFSGNICIYIRIITHIIEVPWGTLSLPTPPYIILNA